VGALDSARLDSLTSWHADWRGLRVAVLGLGVTGFAAADTLAELGAEVVVLDSAPDPQRSRILPVIGVRLIEHPLDAAPHELEEFDPQLLIASPGFPPGHPVLEWAKRRATAVWGDVELAWRLRDKVGEPAEWMLVTGTNGKTTTVQLTAAMLAAHGLRAAECGNIGVPVLDAIRDPAGFDVLVVELSSYQLHHITRTGPGSLHPYSSVCLNVADDHLDWHGSASAYRRAKATVYANVTNACVYNTADEATMHMVEQAEVAEGARAIGFGLGVPGPSDLGIVDGILCDRAFLEERRTSALELTTVGELAGAGLDAPHVVANVLAASALARSFGVPPATIREALRGFRLDAHRIAVVGERGRIRWVDDSKATNPHAADASLRAYPTVVWVLGGLLKGVDIGRLVREHAERLRGAVVIGEDRTAVLEAFARHAPGVTVLEATADETGNVMVEAVGLAASLAREGDTVLLAPAAASMDQFVDYADRGRRFADAVRQLLEGVADDDTPAEPEPPTGT
jgi:UDP-N-acetylmuramoylalanine--D-glutamate ligase